MSARGPSRHFAVVQQFSRFRSEADIQRVSSRAVATLERGSQTVRISVCPAAAAPLTRPSGLD
jgi:hypothetical protein